MRKSTFFVVSAGRRAIKAKLTPKYPRDQSAAGGKIRRFELKRGGLPSRQAGSPEGA